MGSSPTDVVAFAGDDVIRDYIEKYSNWGRWGEEDQRGALNHIGPQQLTAAAGLVWQGKVISMGLPLDLHGLQSGGLRANPLNMMTATGTDYLAGKQDTLPGGFGPSKGFGFADDVLVTPNQAGSQWDGLAHIFWRGQLYNGFDAGHVTSQGAGRCGIEVHRTSFVMRGVPLDVARYKGVDCLEAGYAIIADDLDATAAAQQVEVRTGDALIVRTGMTETRRENWGDYNGGASPGLCLHTAPWLYAHEVAAIATDTWGCEVRLNEIDLFQPLHIIALVQMGISGRSGTSRRSAATARRTACTSSCSPLHRSHHRGGGLPGERAGGKVAPAGPAGRATFPAPRRTRAAGVQARTSIRCSAPRAPRRACRR